jgi:dienelactone hydrolase
MGYGSGGVLIIQEAGGLVSDFSGGNDYLSTGNFVAGSPKVFKGIKLSNKTPTKSLKLSGRRGP